MARIVTYVHHYKRPARKRKAVALEIPTVVATEKSRRRPSKQAAAESVPRSPRRDDGTAQPNTARSGVTTPPPVQKSAIVTAKRRKRITAMPDDGAEVSPEIKAFFARMLAAAGSVTRGTSRKKSRPIISGHGSVGLCWRVLMGGDTRNP
jgi:hypothetical protein